MNILKKTYYWLLLEEVLDDEAVMRRIAELPNPFDSYFDKMREAMHKAKSAETNEELINVNSEVNIWRDKLINAWKRNAKKLDTSIVNEINSLLMMIISRYMELMGGCNTGY